MGFIQGVAAEDPKLKVSNYAGWVFEVTQELEELFEKISKEAVINRGGVGKGVSGSF